ncbi:hypothetical protein D3C72_918900 [compost metagenome]
MRRGLRRGLRCGLGRNLWRRRDGCGNRLDRFGNRRGGRDRCLRRGFVHCGWRGCSRGGGHRGCRASNRGFSHRLSHGSNNGGNNGRNHWRADGCGGWRSNRRNLGRRNNGFRRGSRSRFRRLAGRSSRRFQCSLRTGVAIERQHAQAGHDEARVLVRRQRQFAAAMHGHGIEQLDGVGMQAQRQPRDVGGQRVFGRRDARDALFDRNARQQHRQVGQRPRVRQPAYGQLIRHGQHALGVTRRQGIKQAHQMALVDGAEHAAHGVLGHVAGAIGNGLIGQGQCVAHRTLGGLADQAQGRHFKGDFFVAQHRLQVPDDGVGRHLLQIELQAARQHRHRDLLRIGGGQDEFDVGGRLFQRLQHGVEGVAGQHVHFVDHVDLEAPRARRVHRLFEQLRHFLDAAVRGRIQLQVVNKAPGVDFRTSAADAARLGRDAGFTVERLGQNAGQRGLAHAPRAGKQPGMVQALGVERMSQRADHVILSHEGIERSRPPLAGQYQISHGWIVEPVSRAG